MPALFPPSANTLARVSLAAVVGGAFLLAGAFYFYIWSPYQTRVRVPIPQPVPFSHQHHVGGLGLDCRYCHTSVETSASAGMPAVHTCMTCHSQIWTQADMLAPVRNSFTSGIPVQWNRVHDLPGFVYFHHDIHVSKGVGCSTCHGDVTAMPLTWKEHSLYMKWCLDCHQDPAPNLRPAADIFDPHWVAPPDQREKGAKLLEQNHIQVNRLTDCYTCHR